MKKLSSILFSVLSFVVFSLCATGLRAQYTFADYSFILNESGATPHTFSGGAYVYNFTQGTNLSKKWITPNGGSISSTDLPTITESTTQSSLTAYTGFSFNVPFANLDARYVGFTGGGDIYFANTNALYPVYNPEEQMNNAWKSPTAAVRNLIHSRFLAAYWPYYPVQTEVRDLIAGSNCKIKYEIKNNTLFIGFENVTIKDYNNSNQLTFSFQYWITEEGDISFVPASDLRPTGTSNAKTGDNTYAFGFGMFTDRRGGTNPDPMRSDNSTAIFTGFCGFDYTITDDTKRSTGYALSSCKREISSGNYVTLGTSLTFDRPGPCKKIENPRVNNWGFKVGYNTITFNYKAPAGAGQGNQPSYFYSPEASHALIIISTQYPLSGSNLPQDGTTYNNSSRIGSNTAVAVAKMKNSDGSSVSPYSTYPASKFTNGNSIEPYTVTGLQPGTQYYMYAFPYDANCTGGPFYNVNSTLIPTTQFTTEIAPIGGITVDEPSLTQNSIKLNINNGGKYYLLAYAETQLNDIYKHVPLDARAYTAGEVISRSMLILDEEIKKYYSENFNFTVINPYSNATTVTINNLQKGKDYYFYAWAVEKNGSNYTYSGDEVSCGASTVHATPATMNVAHAALDATDEESHFIHMTPGGWKEGGSIRNELKTDRLGAGKWVYGQNNGNDEVATPVTIVLTTPYVDTSGIYPDVQATIRAYYAEANDLALTASCAQQEKTEGITVQYRTKSGYTKTLSLDDEAFSCSGGYATYVTQTFSPAERYQLIITYRSNYVPNDGNNEKGGFMGFSNLSIAPDLSCKPVYNLNLVSQYLTHNSARISWYNGNSTTPARYEIRYRKSSAPEGQWEGTHSMNHDNVLAYNLTGLDPSTSYTVEVITVCQGENGSSVPASITFETAKDPSLCDPVSNVQHKNITQTGAVITWEADAVSYAVRYKKATASAWSEQEVSSRTCTLSGLEPGTEYVYNVKAYCGSNQQYPSTASSDQSFTTLIQCNPVTNTDAGNITENSAVITWTGNALHKEFKVEYKSQSAVQWSSAWATGSSYSLSGLISGATYSYRVTAYCDNAKTNASAASTQKEFTTEVPCPAVTNNYISGLGENSVTVNWTGSGMSYKLNYKAKSSPDWITHSVAASTSRTITGLQPGTDYDYTITTYCSADQSKKSGEIRGSFKTQETCAVPDITLSNAKTTGNKSTVVVSWQRNNGIQFEVYYKADGASSFTVKDADMLAESYTITNLTPGTKYYVYVKSYCETPKSKPSENSTTKEVTMPYALCNPVTLNAATDVEKNTAKISWTGAGQSYGIFYKKSTESAYPSTPVYATGTDYTLTGLSAGTVYNYKVVAYCAANHLNPSRESAAKEFTTWVECQKPVINTPVEPTQTSAAVSWTGNGVLYEFYYKQDGGGYSAPVEVTSKNYTLQGLNMDTKYYVYVKSYCVAGKKNPSDVSTEAYFTTLPPEQVVCTPVNGNTIQHGNIDRTGAKITWTANADAQSYGIFLKTASGSYPSTPIYTNNTQYTLSGLTAGTVYNYQIVAYCEADHGNASSRSAENEFTTWQNCQKPYNISAGTPDETSATLTWDGNGVAYEVYYKKESDANYTKVDVTGSGRSLDLENLQHTTRYVGYIKSYCVEGNLNESDNSDAFEFTTATPPCEPVSAADITVSNITRTGAELSWTGNALSYGVFYKERSAADYPAVPEYTTQPAYTFSGLDPDKTYDYKITAYCLANHQNASESSPVRSFKTLEVCLKPYDIQTSNIWRDSAVINWDGNAKEYELVYYPVGGSAIEQTVTSTQSNYILHDLSDGTEYAFKIKGYCADNRGNASEESDPVSFTTVEFCPTINKISHENITHNSVDISWVSTKGVEFELSYKERGSEDDYITVMTSSPDYTLTELKPETSYVYYVVNFCEANRGNAGGASSPRFFETKAEPVVIVCNAPDNLSESEITHNTARLYWEGNGVSYDIYYTRKVNGQAAGQTVIVNTPGNKYGGSDGREFTLTGLMPSSTYEYYMVSYCEEGKQNASERSQTHTFTTDVKPACPMPENIEIGEPDMDLRRLTVSWESDAVSFDIKYKSQGASQYNTVEAFGPTFTFEDLSEKTTYEFYIVAYCEINRQDASSATEVMNFTTPAIGCPPAENIRVKSVSSNSAELEWEGSAATYMVMYNEKGTSRLSMKEASENTITLNKLKASTEYVVYLISNCADGTTSDQSETLTFSTRAVGCDIPSLMVAGTTWNSVTVRLSGAEKGYAVNVYAKDEETYPESNYTVYSAESTVTVDGLYAPLHGEYFVRAAAICADDTGDWSQPVLFITDTTPECAAPTNLSTRIEKDLSITVLLWENGPITDYVELNYKEQAEPDFISQTVFTDFYVLRDLKPETVYIWRLTAYCAGGLFKSEPVESEFDTRKAGNEGSLSGALKVNANRNRLVVENPDGRFIKQIEVLNVSGRLDAAFDVNNNGNVLINHRMNRGLALIRVTGKDGESAVYKVMIP